MTQSKNSTTRKTLLSIAKKTPKAVTELLGIRGDSMSVSEDFNAHTDPDRTLKLMKKKKSSFFISMKEGGSSLAIGRTYDSQFLELVNFKVLKALSSTDFSAVPAEISVKYFLLFINIGNERLENMIMDLFSQQTHEVNLRGIRYAWIFSKSGEIYTLKFVRVMNDLSVEDIGPYFELEMETEFYCGDELWKAALGEKKTKKKKNVEKTGLKERIGKVHVDRQDLKDIRLKKSKGYKAIDLENRVE
ncbi:ribosome production factor 2 [Pancytospora epiphaga]|nr:ribosome production factor 2 [Pancytospora epiphaga]